MSLHPGAVVIKDPNAEIVYTWDWSDWLVGAATIASDTFIVSTFTGDATPLVSDNESIVAGATSSLHRLTGGTVGKTYTVTHRIVTNETPAQTEDKSIKVSIREQ